MKAPIISRYRHVTSFMCSLIAGAASQAYAQPPFVETTPVGFVRTEIDAAASSPSVTALSLPLMRSATWRGVASAIDGATVSANLGADRAALINAEPHYIEIQTGGAAGTLIDIGAATNTAITLLEPAAPHVEAGTEIAIRPHSTLTSLFGTGGDIGLITAGTIEEADEVLRFTAYPDPAARFYVNNQAEAWRRFGHGEQEQGAEFFYPGEELTVV